jgi:uncharacterized protein YecE (DUF72 family)
MNRFASAMAPDRRPEQSDLWGDAPPATPRARAVPATPLPAPAPAPERRVAQVAGRPVLVGTSGFSFPDWEGAFYPRGLPPAERLGFYARYFPAVEVNSTYYGIPQPQVMRQMAEKTPPGFEFMVKANRQMTHEATAPDAVYHDFLRCLEPLREAGRFHGVLAQFPWRFRNTPEARRHLLALRGRLGELPLFVEFRHDSWAVEEVFHSLAESGIGYCSVDEPALSGLMPPLARLTGDTAYVRFHGRNARTWWGRGPGDRYDYDYRREEMEEWLGKIRELAERAKKTYVFFNNCHAGQAARNARLMMDMLHGDRR